MGYGQISVTVLVGVVLVAVAALVVAFAAWARGGFRMGPGVLFAVLAVTTAVALVIYNMVLARNPSAEYLR